MRIKDPDPYFNTFEYKYPSLVSLQYNVSRLLGAHMTMFSFDDITVFSLIFPYVI